MVTACVQCVLCGTVMQRGPPPPPLLHPLALVAHFADHPGAVNKFTV